MADSAWYVILDNEEHGPFSLSQIRAAIAQNRIKRTTHLRQEGMGRPRAAATFVELPFDSQSSEDLDYELDHGGAGNGQQNVAPVPAAIPSEARGATADPQRSKRSRKKGRKKSGETPRSQLGFFRALPHALIYPFYGMAGWHLPGLAFGISMFIWVMMLVFPFFGLIGAYSFLLAILTCFVYAGAFLFHIVANSSREDDTPPPFLSLDEPYEQVVVPLGLYSAALALSYSPYLLYVSFTYDLAALDWKSYVFGVYSPIHPGWEEFLQWSDAWRWFIKFVLFSLCEPRDIVGRLLHLVGTIYFPMALVGVATQGKLRGLRPGVVIPAILRVPKPYVVVLLFVRFKFIVIGLLSHSFSHYMVFLPSLALVFVLLYLLAVQARLIGLLYSTHAAQLEPILSS